MRKLIRVDGTEQDLPKPQTLEQIYRLIGCRTIDTVHPICGDVVVVPDADFA